MEAELLEEALNSLHEGLQVLSPEWRYLYVNDAVVRQGRKTRDDLVGRTMHECYPGIETTAMFHVLARCMTERRSETMENEFVHEDGSRAWFELRIRPCRAGIVVASLDVSERKSVEVRLQGAYALALRELATPRVRATARLRRLGAALLPDRAGVLGREPRVQHGVRRLRALRADGRAVLRRHAGLPLRERLDPVR